MTAKPFLKNSILVLLAVALGLLLAEVTLGLFPRRALRTVDPLPQMRAAGDMALYHTIDDHSTATGNRIAAGVLARELMISE